MSFGINLGGLWKPKRAGAKSAASGQFTLPACVTLDPARGHRFVITERATKKNINEPDFDLWLFGADDDKDNGNNGNVGGGLGLGAPERQPGDDIPFDGAGAPS